jgi:hypothetical protein
MRHSTKIFLTSTSSLWFSGPQGQIVPRLGSLFGSLLAETSWLLHQHALEAFAHFAEVRGAKPADVIG